MSILVVEDDPSVLRSHARLLERDGFTVLSAVNGIEAFDHIQTAEVDAILCDVDMPTLDGTGFFEQLEELQPGKEPGYGADVNDLVVVELEPRQVGEPG